MNFIICINLKILIQLLNIKYTDYDVVAKGFGGIGIKVDSSNENNLEEVFQNAREHYANGKSVLLNVLIGKKYFKPNNTK